MAPARPSSSFSIRSQVRGELPRAMLSQISLTLVRMQLTPTTQA